MIELLRDWIQSVKTLIEVWRLARWFSKLTDAQQEDELARITAIAKEERATRRRP